MPVLAFSNATAAGGCIFIPKKAQETSRNLLRITSTLEISWNHLLPRILFFSTNVTRRGKFRKFDSPSVNELDLSKYEKPTFPA
jgi:hypothetical protein